LREAKDRYEEHDPQAYHLEVLKARRFLGEISEEEFSEHLLELKGKLPDQYHSNESERNKWSFMALH